MFRTALKPRWLGLLALLVAVVVSFVWLGLWQFNVAQDDSRVEALQEQAAQSERPLSEVLQPQRPFPANGSGMPVSVTGEYDPSGQVLVPDRVLRGRTGYWVVTPLVVGETGAWLPVMRGFVSTPTEATPPAAGPVEVHGTLAPSEAPITRTDLPEGQLDSIDLSVLVNRWPADVYNAFIFATQETPDPTAATITRVPPPDLVVKGITWRNAGYGLQWWVFAGFAVYMYVRMLREDHRHDQATAPPGPPTGGPPDGPPGDQPDDHPSDHPSDHPHDHPERSATIHV